MNSNQGVKNAEFPTHSITIELSEPSGNPVNHEQPERTSEVSERGSHHSVSPLTRLFAIGNPRIKQHIHSGADDQGDHFMMEPIAHFLTGQKGSIEQRVSVSGTPRDVIGAVDLTDEAIYGSLLGVGY